MRKNKISREKKVDFMSLHITFKRSFFNDKMSRSQRSAASYIAAAVLSDLELVIV